MSARPGPPRRGSGPTPPKMHNLRRDEITASPSIPLGHGLAYTVEVLFCYELHATPRSARKRGSAGGSWPPMAARVVFTSLAGSSAPRVERRLAAEQPARPY